MSLAPFPSAKGVDDELGRIAAMVDWVCCVFKVFCWTSSTKGVGFVGYCDEEVENDEEVGILELYVEAIAAEAIALFAMSSVRVTYVSGLGQPLGQSGALWLT